MALARPDSRTLEAAISRAVPAMLAFRRVRGASSLLAAGALLIVGASAPSHALAAAPRSDVLSNERTLSRWAYSREPVLAHRSPAPGSPAVARLRLMTEEGSPEIYLALRRLVDVNGREWIQVRLPTRPNGRKGWVRREALGRFHVVRTQLRVRRATFRAILYRRGRPIWRSRIGVGTRARPTPAGRFYVRERIRLRPDGPLGPLVFGTSAYSRRPWLGGYVIGVCGTDKPETVPGRVTPGSIRVPNEAIVRLGKLMPLGTPIHIT